MKFKGKEVLKKSKTPTSSFALYVGSIIVALIAIASLINNVLLFKSSIADYVAQGYTKAQILQHIIPGQLLPAIFEGVAVYGGIAFVLFGAGMINHKISKSLSLLSIEKNNLDENIIDIDTEQNEVNDEISEIIEIADNN